MFVVYLLGFIWCLPSTLLFWIFFCIPHWIAGTFESVEWRRNLAIVWDVANDSKFFKKSMKGWYGFVGGANIISVDTPGKFEKTPDTFKAYLQHLMHEMYHVFQNYVLGIFFYPVYIAIALFIRAFLKDKHAHHDHPMERMARKYAGQQIDIPREDWIDGPNDRWPWN